MAKQQDVLVQGENLHVSKNVAQEQSDQQKSQQPERKEVKDMEKFSSSRTVRAAKLRGVNRLGDGNFELVPEDSAFAPIQLGGNEAANIKGFGSSDNSKDYGYVVIGDDGRREWMSAADFESTFKK
jgi:hypothetical protein